MVESKVGSKSTIAEMSDLIDDAASDAQQPDNYEW
jgi:hypothetical protein